MSSKSEHAKPIMQRLWSTLPEPRDQRVSHFLMYASTLVGGIVATASLPVTLASLIGPFMVLVLGAFSLLGSVIAMAGVVTSFGWLEQVGDILLFTAVLIYSVTLLFASTAAVGPWFAGALAIGLAQRWIEIHLKTR